MVESYNEAVYVFESMKRATGRLKMGGLIIRNSDEKRMFTLYGKKAAILPVVFGSP